MKPTDLRGILQYIPQFREKTFILAIDGAIVTDENFATLLLDVALLWSLNIRIVLVHGAAAQIKALAEQQHLTASDFEGTGVTDATTLMLALTARGVASCAQGALSLYPEIVREHLAIGADRKLLFGISFGYEDANVRANAARVGRAPLDEAARFHR